MFELLLFVIILLISATALIELFYPTVVTEGFQQLIGAGDSALWTRWMPRRGDIGTIMDDEEPGYIRNPRYFNNYTDVQRLGVNHDFCRMIAPKSAPNDLFFSCALGGTEGLSSVKFRTTSVNQGLSISRDDYMNIINGYNGYCRILKDGNGVFSPKCNTATDTGFSNTLTTDGNPPEDIRTLVEFYSGIIFWLRFRDDMLDYAQNLTIQTAGKMKIDERPNPDITRGLEFDGISQYLRIGDNPDLSFGDHVMLRYMRSVTFWVYFESFTNNAHIIDFGNGPAQDNVWIGISGRGNSGLADTTMDGPLSSSRRACDIIEVPPQVLMKTTSANINEYECIQTIIPNLQPDTPTPVSTAITGTTSTADLIYEIWDGKQSKKHIKVKNAITLKRWTHVTITATNKNAFRPDIDIYIDNKKIHTVTDAWLPLTNFTTNNYIGKSNWYSETSQYDDVDELFKGRLFDLRTYTKPLTPQFIKDTYSWGKKLLGLTRQS